MTLRQLPGFAFRSPTDYANEMDRLHGRTSRSSASGVVDLLERLQLFHVFTLDLVQRRRCSCWSSRSSPARSTGRRGCGSSPRRSGWSSRTRTSTRRCPTGCRWPGSRRRRRRRGRCAATGSSSGSEVADGATFVYGDRNRWTKLATLVSHLGPHPVPRGGGRDRAVRRRAGPRRRRGRHADRPADRHAGPPARPEPRVRGARVLETGMAERLHHATSPCTATASCSPRRSIRVNDPLSVGGYTFHQNGFGPAPDLVIRDDRRPAAVVRPVPLTDAGRRAAVRRVRRARPRRRPRAAAPAPGGRHGRAARAAVRGPSASNADGTPEIVGARAARGARGESATRPSGTDSRSSCAGSASTRS